METVNTEVPVVETPVTVTPENPVVETPATDQEETLLGKKEEAKTEEVKVEVPEKYELKLPEGMSVDEKVLGALTPVFQKHKLSQEVVQELAEAYAPVIKEQVQVQQKVLADSYKQTVEDWKTESQQKLGANAVKELSYAAKFINKMSDTPQEAQELREFLNETGVGNKYLLSKILIKGGKSISEDPFVEPNKQSTGGNASIYDHSDSKATLK